ncbi:MAG: hypothetical protein R2830_08405 [Saprospiraceae bacterium]
MKKAFFLLLPFLFLFLKTNAQTDRDAIRKRVGEYFEATEKKDWKGVMDMIYPKLFSYIGKEDMAQVFKDMESEGMNIEMKNFEAKSISDIVVFGGEKFALLNYDVGMTIFLTSQEFRDSSVQAILKTSFETSYGADNIIHNKANYSFDINAFRSMFAVAREGSDEWFFVENDPTQDELTAMLIPEEVRRQLLPMEKKN